MQKTNTNRRNSKFLRILLMIIAFFAVLVLVSMILFAIYVDTNIEKNIDEEMFGMLGSDSKTRLYYYQKNSTNGEMTAIELEGADLYGGYRCIYAEYEQMPQDLIDAFVSIEDKRFFEHNGVDWKRTISAGVNYFLKFNNSFGGSTITQQLIKNVTDKDEYSFQRKLQEIFWALDLETKMDKQEILGLYLNIINLSQGCYGVQAASNYYFSKDVSQLSLNESACIAAITNSPSYYDPIRNPEHNLQRKDIILKEMYAQGYITEEELTENLGVVATLSLKEAEASSTIHSWYVDMVIEDVIQDLIEEKGYSRAVANLMIYTGGMKIYTAMDPEIQTIVEDYYAKTSHFYSGSPQTHPESSMIIIDPQNGDILGIAGAIGEKSANRIQNFATQTLRPAGSVIKPLSVYAPAIDQKLITWGTVYDDVPVNFGEDSLKTPWPKNASDEYRGLTDINTAIENSINTVTVRVLEDLGLETSFDFLYNQLQMKSLIRSGYTPSGEYITDMDFAALALGQLNYGVTVKEITAAYSIFVNRGIYYSPRSYYKVTDGVGSILLENQNRGEAVVSKETSMLMSAMLENVVKNGTAKAISLQETIMCAGKTGTTQSNYDRWYIGYTPYVVGGVWYGYEYPRTLSGKNQCIEIWDTVMKRIHERKAWAADHNDPMDDESIIQAEYCADSGMLVSEACLRDPRGSRAKTGYFMVGTEPKEYCTCHVPVAYDIVNGGVAVTGDCPKENIRYVGLITVERSFPVQIYVTDAQYVWRALKENILPETAPALPFFYRSLADGEFCGISNTPMQYNRFCRTDFDYYAWKQKHPYAQ